MKKLLYPTVALVYVIAFLLGLLIAIKPDTAFFVPLSDVSQTAGILMFTVLLFGVVRFIGYIFSVRKSGLRGQGWFTRLVAGYLQQIKDAGINIYSQSQSHWRERLPSVRKLLLLTAASAYLLILAEWIFHVTKVSFLDSLSLDQKISVLLHSGLFLAVVGMVFNAVLLLLELLLRYLRLAWLAILLNTVVPAALFTSLVILWVDTFTYTIFRFGILTSDGIARVNYGILVGLLFLGFYRWLLRVQGLSSSPKSKPGRFNWLGYGMLGLLTVSLVLAVVQFTPQSAAAQQEESQVASSVQLPDIILIGGDGLSARNMSLYGYERETTPNMDAIADVSLVAENAFTNDSKTYGSIISMLTGKMPTRTRIIFPPDILHGIDADQHLPGILKDMGYTTAQIGVNTYVDANTWNIHNAFDWVNQRTVQGDTLVKTLEQLGYGSPAYFIFTIEGRLANRLLQALCIETVENPFSTVADAPEWRGDSRRMDDLLNLLESTPEPLFVHVHLLETHGPKYEPAIRNFSVGVEQTEKWMVDYYDDAILSCDAYFGDLIDALKASGRFDQTLLIIYSDHGMGFQTADRIPLLIHFPNDQYMGRIQTNVQNLDIAPTILDYLGVTVPDWMEGDSILQFSDQVREPIFAVRMNISDEIEWPPEVIYGTNGDPFETENNQFSVLQIFYCQRMYQFELATREWKLRSVYKYTAPCSTSDLLSMEEVRNVAIDFLANQGFDPSIIP